MSKAEEERAGARTRWATGLALGALVLLPLLFYAGMILGGREPAAPDTIAVRPLGEWAREATRELGTTPLWNPYIFSGMPSYGSYIHTPASDINPLKWILGLFPGQRGIRYFLLMLLGGFSAYAFFRRQGVSAPAAATAALGFVLTPYIPGLIEAGHSTKLRALMHVPLVLLALDLFLSRPGALASAFLALAVAMLGWANHPQILYYAAILGLLYALGRLLSDRAAWPAARLLQASGWLVLTGAIAFCLIAEPTLAVREYAPYSIRGSGEGGGVDWRYATAWSFPPRELVTFLFPEYYGLKGATYFGSLPFTQSTHYVGIVLLLVAGFGIARRRDRRIWIWLGITLIVLLIGFGRHVPILYGPLFQLLPYFNKFRVPSMIYATLPLALGFLVALGLDALGTPSPASRRSRKGGGQRGWWAAAGIAGGAAVLALVIGLAARSTGMLGPEWIRPSEAQLDPAQLDALRSARWDMRIASIVRGLLLVAIALAAIPFARRLHPPWGAGLLGAIVLADLCLVGAKFVDFEKPERIEEAIRSTPEIEYLQEQGGPFRILPIDDFSSNRYVAFGIATVGGYQPAKLRNYQDLLERNLLTSPAVLSMLNVRYLLSQRDPGLEAFERVAGGVYRFRDGLPRAWFVPSWTSLPDEEAVLRALASPDFDPAALALFSGGAVPDLPRSSLPLREVAVDSIDAHRLELRVGDAAEAGLLVVSEIDYPPGWRATIDGSPAPILRVNHCLRALAVGAGAHRIEMVFRSKAYETGRTLSRAGGAALLLLAAGGLLALSRRRSLSA